MKPSDRIKEIAEFDQNVGGFEPSLYEGTSEDIKNAGFILAILQYLDETAENKSTTPSKKPPLTSQPKNEYEYQKSKAVAAMMKDLDPKPDQPSPKECTCMHMDFGKRPSYPGADPNCPVHGCSCYFKCLGKELNNLSHKVTCEGDCEVTKDCKIHGKGGTGASKDE